jgi:hypothetical protein
MSWSNGFIPLDEQQFFFESLEVIRHGSIE